MKRILIVIPLCALLVSCAMTEAMKHFGEGTRALERGDWETAIAELEKARELDPKTSTVRNNLAVAYGAIGRTEESWWEVRQAVLLDERNVYALRHFARQWYGFKVRKILAVGHSMAQVEAELGTPDMATLKGGDPSEGVWFYGPCTVEFKGGTVVKISEPARFPPAAKVPLIWRLAPRFDAGTKLLIAVHDERPALETEKTPSTKYLYTGAVSPTEAHTVTVGHNIGILVVKNRGARQYAVTNAIPDDCVGLDLTLAHWYSRLDREANTPSRSVEAEFAGTLALRQDGRILAQCQVRAQDTSTVENVSFVWDSQQQQTSKPVLAVMEKTANGAFNDALIEILNALEKHWPAFSP